MLLMLVYGFLFVLAFVGALIILGKIIKALLKTIVSLAPTFFILVLVLMVVIILHGGV